MKRMLVMAKCSLLFIILFILNSTQIEKKSAHTGKKREIFNIYTYWKKKKVI